jgi:hypothetical protein
MSELTDRYVAAVLRAIPPDRRDDVDRELRAAIDDAVEARLESGVDEGAVETAVINELGDPGRLAADYSDRPLWLLGPAVYLDWLRVLRMLLATVVPLAGVTAMVIRFATGEGLIDSLFGGLGLAFVVALHVVFWTTLGFVILERSGEKSPFTWTVDRLPLTPDRQIGYGETVWGLVVLVLTVLGIFAQRNLALVTNDAGDPVPMLDPAAWDLAIPLLLLMLVVEAGFLLVKYRAGRWSTRLAVANLVLNLLFGGLTIWLLLSGRLLNPEFVAALPEELPLAVEPLAAAAVAAVCVWSTVEGFVRAGQASKRRLTMEARAGR